MNDFVIETKQLTKIYGEQTAVSKVNLHVKKGEIYGFLGPNGAGKTTVMKMITNLWKPSAIFCHSSFLPYISAATCSYLTTGPAISCGNMHTYIAKFKSIYVNVNVS